ncbi:MULTISPECIES: flagellar filament capping protein FliD [unclassified Neptuniibacter]|uniref:flagellar filament capping protein FliD n=1 Tax=unclassified Neptuniibacter TaxID=2630693 RepID=UPI000C5B8D2B|nr:MULTISPECIES: flagellar filament capping protein FliD [unclassified Neptuniibacter]MAY40946.1 flagellar hook protein [Oceanospirillaceae bacterium]|tara:strand:- start:34998 stop:37115 length:2118 start_codon:yes stop_codon:yes gene_type:complete
MSDSIISSLGAGSGINTTSLVTQLVEIEKAPREERLDTTEEKLEAQISAYGTLQSSLSELQSVLDPLSDNDTFNARSVAFPDTDVITPNSVDAGAQTGTYQIEVVEVAQSQSLATGAYADKDEALNEAGTLTISFGTWTYDEDADPGADVDTDQDPYSFATNDARAALNITVEASDSLQDIADKINAEDADVQASVLLVDGQYQLLLTAPSGADNALRVSSDDATKGDSTGLSVFEYNETEHSQVTETQQAQDAELLVNGLTVYRETNEIDDVIQGFNFSLNKAEPGTSFTFTVSEDTSTAEQAIRDFVEAYNLFYETAQNLVGYSTDEENQTVRGDLATDGTAKALVNQIRDTIGSLVPGIEDGFTSLTNVGIRTELDGSLSIDEDDFSDAMANNFALVETLFATDVGSSNDEVSVSVGSYASGTVPGSYDVVVTTDPEKATVTADAMVDGGNIGFDSAADTVSIADASLLDLSFKVTVDGVESDTITLTGSYSTADEIRADLQSLINGDTNISGANVAVDVTYDEATDQFAFTSRSYGSASSVSFDDTDFGADIAELGFITQSDTGVDVVGTIDGVAGFGSGNVLLPAIDSDPYGLNFTIGENAVAAGSVTVDFSRGFAGELDNLINSFLSSNGAIKLREENINNALEGVADDRVELDRKMEKLELRLYSQFLAMERIVNSFQSTGNQLDGILDRLPFTASNG